MKASGSGPDHPVFARSSTTLSQYATCWRRPGSPDRIVPVRSFVICRAFISRPMKASSSSPDSHWSRTTRVRVEPTGAVSRNSRAMSATVRDGGQQHVP